MKFLILVSLFITSYYSNAQSNCPVCDSTNNIYTEAIEPLNWLELIKNPEKVDTQKFGYQRIEAELTISAKGEIIAYRFNNPFVSWQDSLIVDSLIKLSPTWVPARVYNYLFESKKAVLFFIKPFKIAIDEYSCFRSMVYNYPCFLGGINAWNRFLKENLEAKIILSANEINNYCKNAIVQFCINKEGVLIDTKIINFKSLHPSQIEAIKNLATKACKWIPGEWSGRKINGSFITVIQFNFSEVPFS